MSDTSLNLNDIKNNMSEEVIKSNVEGLELFSDTHPFRLSLRVRNFESESEFNKFIKNVETCVRRSIEYRLWRKYIKEVLGITTCMITNERTDQCTVEVHHHIPSLFTLVKSLINKKINNQEEFSTFDISLEAIKLHFQNKIGYVTLVKSLHEKFHNGHLQVPKEYIKGDYMYFINEFSRYLDDSDLEILNLRLAINETDCNWYRNNYEGQQSRG